jgi:hypothetical protein
MVPHVAARKTHQRFEKFSFVTPKRLLQQYLPTAEVVTVFQHSRQQLTDLGVARERGYPS